MSIYFIYYFWWGFIFQINNFVHYTFLTKFMLDNQDYVFLGKNISAVSDVLIYSKISVFYSQNCPLFLEYANFGILWQYVQNVGYLL